MFMPLPEIIYNEKYRNQWFFEEGMPVAKENALSEIKEAISKFQEEYNENERSLIVDGDFDEIDDN